MNAPDMNEQGDLEQQAEQLAARIQEEMEQRRTAELKAVFDADIPVNEDDRKFVERAMQDLALSPDKTAPFIEVPREQLFDFLYKAAKLQKAPVIALLMQLGDAAQYMGKDIFDLPPEYTRQNDGSPDADDNLAG